MVNGKKRRLSIIKIQSDDGSWIEGNDISQAAIQFFEKEFSKEYNHKDLTILDCFPKLITPEDNRKLIVPPTMEQVKNVIFSMNS